MVSNLLKCPTVWLPSDKSGVRVQMSSMITTHANRLKVSRDSITHEMMLEYLENWCKRNGFAKQWDLFVAEGIVEVSCK